MQGVSQSRTIVQAVSFRLPSRRSSTLHLLSLSRSFATQKSPGFGSNTPPSAGPRSYKPRSPDAAANQSPGKKSQSSGNQSSESVGNSRVLTLITVRYGKFLLVPIFAYIGYRIYTWQTNPHRSVILQPRFFTPFILDIRKKVSSTSSILYLRSVPEGQNADNVTEAWRTGIWSAEVMQPELQISRCYTPLPPDANAKPEELRLLVRQEPHGEVSSLLHRIYRGTILNLRGPRIEYVIPEDVEEILFLAGGTGIAPALQAAYTLFNYRSASQEKGPRLRILWANRRSEDAKISVDSSSSAESENILVQEVESLNAKYGEKINVEYFVDEEKSYITEGLLRKHLGDADLASNQPAQDKPAGKRLLLVSGPEGFVNVFAGPKSMRGGKEIQGPRGGILERIELKDWEIWKL